MPDKRKFVNPLTQPSTSTETSTSTDTSTSTFTFTSTRPKRKRFDETHIRVTWWIDRDLNEGFNTLAAALDMSKSELLDKAVFELLHKYGVR